jgi:beta-lactamase regulating signal transducer with metallopeptidase domain
MTLAAIGWIVVHTLWVGTALAGAVALVLSLVNDRHAAMRYRIASAALVATVVLPVIIVATTFDPMSSPVRMRTTSALDAVIGFPAVVSGRGVLVRAAAILWAVGVVWSIVRLSQAWRRVRAIRDGAATGAPSALRDAFAAVRRRLLVGRSVTLVVSRRASVPMVVGWRRPAVVVPDGIASHLDEDQIAAILAHELTHVRRRDDLANLAQLAADTLLWFHPAARWLSRTIRTEREYRCDDVAAHAGSTPARYARALAALDDARDAGHLVVAAASGTLLDRIQRIVGQPRTLMPAWRGVLVLTVAVLVASAGLALAFVVPPGVSLDAKLRQRQPAPAAAGEAARPALPRSPRR